MLASPSGTRGEAGFFLSFSVVRWPIGYNSSADRFLGLGGVEVNLETARGPDSPYPYRRGLGGGAWFETGSIPTPHISYSQGQEKLTACLPSTTNLGILKMIGGWWGCDKDHLGLLNSQFSGPSIVDPQWATDQIAQSLNHGVLKLYESNLESNVQHCGTSLVCVCTHLGVMLSLCVSGPNRCST